MGSGRLPEHKGSWCNGSEDPFLQSEFSFKLVEDS